MARPAETTQARAAAVQIVKSLRTASPPHEALLAGGCVRDELLGLKPTDYDVATSATPEQVCGLFRHTRKVGQAFGVVLVPLEGATVEVATFRSDGPYSDSRRPDSVIFADARADAQRRDFTINALFLDPLAQETSPALGAAPGPGVAGRVIDLVGGMADLSAGVVRAVGDPDQRLAEDHLRALRAVRFAARFGFVIEPATAAAISRHAWQLAGVSKERIGDELRRMLVRPPAARNQAVQMLQQLGLDAPALDEPHLSVATPTVAGVADHASVPVVLAGWALDRHKQVPDSSFSPEEESRLASRWRRALCLSNDERAELAGVLESHRAILNRWNGASIAAQKRIAGGPWFDSAVDVLRARNPDAAHVVFDRFSDLAKHGPGIRPDPLITGDDLVAAGFKPGPAFKRILDLVYDRQLEGEIVTKLQGLELAMTLRV